MKDIEKRTKLLEREKELLEEILELNRKIREYQKPVEVPVAPCYPYYIYPWVTYGDSSGDPLQPYLTISGRKWK